MDSPESDNLSSLGFVKAETGHSDPIQGPETHVSGPGTRMVRDPNGTRMYRDPNVSGPEWDPNVSGVPILKGASGTL